MLAKDSLYLCRMCENYVHELFSTHYAVRLFCCKTARRERLLCFEKVKSPRGERAICRLSGFHGKA